MENYTGHHVVYDKNDKEKEVNNLVEVTVQDHETKHIRKVSGYSGSEEKDS